MDLKKLLSYLAHGIDLNDAVKKVKEYINNAIVLGSKYIIGKGYGPVHHFFNFWE